MRKNVGSLDAFIRITIGLFGLAWGISQMVRSNQRFPRVISFLSAIKVAEGIIRFCPGLALFGINTLDEEDRAGKAPYPTQFYARRKIPPQSSTEERGVNRIE